MDRRHRRAAAWGRAALLGFTVVLGAAGPAAAGSPLGGPATQPVPVATGTPALALRLAPGDSRIYQIRSAGVLDVDYGLLAANVSDGLGQKPRTPGAASRRVTADYDLTATLHWRVVGRDGGGWVLAARLQAVDARIDGAADPRRALLEAPFVVRVSPEGAMRSFAFMRQYPDDLARTIRGLVEPLQVVFATQADAAAWDATEQSAGVVVDARYVVGAPDPATGTVRVTKTKSRIYGAPSELGGALPGGISTRVVRAEAAIALDPAHGTVAHIDASEETTTTSTATGTAFLAAHVGTYRAARVERPLAPLATTVTGATEALADEAFARARLYDVDPRIAPRVEGMTLPAMLALFEAELARNQASAHLLLKSYLRRYPSQVVAMARAFDGRATESDDPAVVVGFAAIAAAGHHEAQVALVDVLAGGGGTPRWTPRSKERALISMMDLAMPEPFVLTAVWSYRSAIQPTDAAASALQSIATNVYGALGDAQRHNDAITVEVVRVLTALLRAGDARQRVLALDALANVGDFARVSPLALASFGAAEQRVRVAAFGTFRRMPGDLAFSQFALRFAAETDPSVLAEAAIVARDMPDSNARNAWARALVTTATARALLVPLVQIVGRELARHPENEATLRDLLETQHDRPVRRAIYAFVGPSVEGGRP